MYFLITKNLEKGLYSNVFGYLSGTALILMTAKICLIYQSASLTFLVQRFFQIYSLWWVLVYLKINFSFSLPELFLQFVEMNFFFSRNYLTICKKHFLSSGINFTICKT